MKAQGFSDQEILDIVQVFGRTHGEPMERKRIIRNSSVIRLTNTPLGSPCCIGEGSGKSLPVSTHA